MNKHNNKNSVRPKSVILELDIQRADENTTLRTYTTRQVRHTDRKNYKPGQLASIIIIWPKKKAANR